MDESRKQFDQYLKSQQLKPVGWIRDEYWKIWKASRAAFEIELQKPKQGSLPGDYHIGYDSGAESQYENDVEAIRAAGIKVKE